MWLLISRRILSILSKKRNPDGDPGAGPLLTLIQFIFIALMAIPDVVCSNVRFTASFLCRIHLVLLFICVRTPSLQPRTFFLKPTVIPLKYYVYQATLFFSMSYLNNVVFSFHVSQPVHVVVRSSNLVITCILGAFLGKSYELFGCSLVTLVPGAAKVLLVVRYSWRAMCCVALVTVGVFVATAAEAVIGEASALRTGGCCGPDANLTSHASPPPSPDAAAAVSAPLPQSHRLIEGTAALTSSIGLCRSSGGGVLASHSSSWSCSSQVCSPLMKTHESAATLAAANVRVWLYVGDVQLA